jgi:predicted ATP-grasp superfamily ATP-dependent carboligase
VCNVVLPNYVTAPDAFAAEVVQFAREHHTRVVLPTADASIAAMTPHRAELSSVGCTLALAGDTALEIANDKNRTLKEASRLGISFPRSVQINDAGDLPAAVAAFGYPFVLKPTISWTGQCAERVVPVEVINEAEAVDAVTRFLATGTGILAQEWACGRREGVSLFIADGDVMASCGHVAYRTTPALGGASVMRESITVPWELLDAAVRLAKAIGLEGPCEVEFRRDAGGRPLLMEVNARLAGTLENAIQSGVDFPLMTWQWATGQQVSRVESYRAGVRTRWLHGDMRWLRENQSRIGRPDSVPRSRSFWIFVSEFARTRHYDYLDRRDLGPTIAELQGTASSWHVLIHRS